MFITVKILDETEKSNFLMGVKRTMIGFLNRHDENRFNFKGVKYVFNKKGYRCFYTSSFQEKFINKKDITTYTLSIEQLLKTTIKVEHDFIETWLKFFVDNIEKSDFKNDKNGNARHGLPIELFKEKPKAALKLYDKGVKKI